MSTHLIPQLSVLDLVPVRTGQSSVQALAASLDLAALADRLGLTRYWFAEHHNMAGVAASSPPVMIAAAAARTTRIRVGSGGVMLPNHAPLVVAEQFAALEAIAPGRIDLGIGRAPGSDPVVSSLLRSSGPTATVEQFPQHVRDIITMMSPDGAQLRVGDGHLYRVAATPAATGSPDVWLLGSSDYSARLAAELGLPYVFANHFAGQGMAQIVGLYRDNYRPSEAFPEPRTFLTMNTVVAESDDEAHARALPQLRAMARLRTGRAMRPLETVEEALADRPDHVMEVTIESMRERWLIGDADFAAKHLRGLAEQHAVDEVMIVPVAGTREGEPLDATPGRATTLELLAGALSAT
ncbi:MsnO8 family LLM class oxidoreductase [Myceligenerans crystallogenes]|uniref:LLM class flavin-dependent oxidoreductase n=1 Tax=Myceligenerans crystallogenes TaxID=316335 RepID=A0ABN2NF83_9MICO